MSSYNINRPEYIFQIKGSINGVGWGRPISHTQKVFIILLTEPGFSIFFFCKTINADLFIGFLPMYILLVLFKVCANVVYRLDRVSTDRSIAHVCPGKATSSPLAGSLVVTFIGAHRNPVPLDKQIYLYSNFPI